MVWGTKGAVPAAELARLAADIPLIIGRNWARYETASWKWTAAGGDGDTDISVTDFEARHAGDDLDYLITKPTTGDPRYFNINLGSAIGEIDSFALKNHNLATIAAALTLQIATDAAFTVPLDILTLAAPATNKRIVKLDLRESGDSTPQRFTGVRYARLKIDPPGSAVPQLGEVWLGRRRQLYFTSNYPHAPYRLRSVAPMSESDSGIVGGTARHKNRRRLDFGYVVKDSTAISDFETLFRDELDGGTLPFLYVPSPSTAPSDALWIWPDQPADIEGDDTGFGERRFRLRGSEQGPNFLAKGLGL